MGCQAFAGRVGQWLCSSSTIGYTNCVGYVRQKQASLCFGPGSVIFADEPTVVSMVGQQGCQRIGNAGLVFACRTPGGQNMCGRFSKGGVALTCRS